MLMVDHMQDMPSYHRLQYSFSRRTESQKSSEESAALGAVCWFIEDGCLLRNDINLTTWTFTFIPDTSRFWWNLLDSSECLCVSMMNQKHSDLWEGWHRSIKKRFCIGKYWICLIACRMLRFAYFSSTSVTF